MWAHHLRECKDKNGVVFIDEQQAKMLVSEAGGSRLLKRQAQDDADVAPTLT